MIKARSTRHEERRAQILDAAARCFARDGFRGAAISAICGEAGISPGHLYHYFASKEAIIADMIGLMVEQAARHFDEIARAENVLDGLVGVVDRFEDVEDCDEALGLDLLAETGRNPTIAAIVREHSRSLAANLAAQIRRGQQLGQIRADIVADEAAMLLIHLMDGLGAIGLRAPEFNHDTTRRLRKDLIRRLLAP